MVQRNTARHLRERIVNPVERPLTTDELFRRIDEMPMSAGDREQAKANLRTAEAIAEGLSRIVTAIRSLAASIAPRSTRRSAPRNSPAPR
jgi:hypothetical protein